MTNASTAWDDVIAKRHPPKTTNGKDNDAHASVGANANDIEAQITERVRTEEIKRSTDIISACDLAGHSHRASALIAEGKSLSQVLALLGSRKRA